MFDLTAHITNQRRQVLAGAIKQACREIAACPDQQRQWRALRQLRLLQAMARGAA